MTRISKIGLFKIARPYLAIIGCLARPKEGERERFPDFEREKKKERTWEARKKEEVSKHFQGVLARFSAFSLHFLGV